MWISCVKTDGKWFWQREQDVGKLDNGRDYGSVIKLKNVSWMLERSESGKVSRGQVI